MSASQLEQVTRERDSLSMSNAQLHSQVQDLRKECDRLRLEVEEQAAMADALQVAHQERDRLREVVERTKESMQKHAAWGIAMDSLRRDVPELAR